MNSLVRSHRRRGAILGLAIAAFGTVPACQNAPAPGATPATGTPIVRSVEPTVPLPDPAPQTIRLVGLDFRAGLTVTITLPSTTVFDVPSSALQLRSATLLDVSVTLSEPGSYRVVVRNANGFRSDPFDFSVVNQTDRKPVVESLQPAAVTRSTLAQTIAVSGRNFLIGVTIRLSDPLGVIRTLDDASIIRRSDTALDVRAIFDRQGIYTMVIVNPSGDTSETATLTVN